MLQEKSQQSRSQLPSLFSIVPQLNQIIGVPWCKPGDSDQSRPSDIQSNFGVR